jgi:hypothetical protein
MIILFYNQVTAYFKWIILCWVIPLLIALVIYIGSTILGDKFFIILIGSIIQLILNVLLGYVYGVLQRKFMHGKDIRMRYLD